MTAQTLPAYVLDVTEAAVDAAKERVKGFDGIIQAILEAAAPHIGGEAIRQAVAASRESVPVLDGVDSIASSKGYRLALDDVLKHAEGES